MSTFSEKIRILRKNREWTQAQLAEALSVSESTVQKWEVDKNTPPVTEIKRLPWSMTLLIYRNTTILRPYPLRIFIPDQQLRIPRRTWSTMQP